MSEIVDYIVGIVFLFIFGIAILSSSMILDRFDQATDDRTVNQTILHRGMNTVNSFDTIFGFVLIGLALSLFVTAFLVDTHPVFLPINLIAYIILIFLSGIFANTFIQFAESQSIIQTANQFGSMIYVWRNLPQIMTVLAGINLIVMFAKYNQQRSV